MLPQLGQAQSYTPPDTSIRVMCLTDNMDFTDQWPRKMAFPPRLGDMVKAMGSNNVLEILEVTHWQDETGPFVVVRLGVSRTNQTAIDGGVGAESSV